MKKIPCFGAFLTSILMVLFAVSATWADPVSLTPYTNDDTGESFYYVNMPYAAATSCTQNYSNPVAATASLDIVETDFAVLTDANGRITFKLYDDGGMGGSVTQNAEGNYHNCVNSTLTVTVPENYRLSVQGRMNTEGVSDYMFIYDAPDNSGTPLGGKKIFSTDYVNGEEKGPYFSTGNAFTFFFETDYSGNYAGFDFTVSVLPVNSVSVNSVSNGEMAGTTSAVEGETVTLTATPSEGYVFGGIKVLDENGNRVPVNMNGNTVTFTMPATPVTVTPHFGDPEILSFDDDGCLDNGTFFLVKCEDNACTIAQGTEGSQGDGFMSFACWSDMVQYIEEDEGRLSSTIVLGSPLNLGGYDEDAGKCRMAFVPFGSNHAGFDGNENTVDGFCGKDAGNGSWFVYANYVKNVSLTNAYVYGLSAYLISGNTISNVTVDRATIIGGTGAGVIGNAASIGNVTVKNSNIHVGEYIEGATIETVYAGALMAQMRTVEWSGPVLLQGNIVSAENDLMGAYLGGVVGEVEGYETTVNLTGISVEDATVNGGANGYYVGGLVGANSRGVSVAISQCSFTGTVSGGVVGGIIGHADNYESQVIIKNTYSVSTISGTTAGYIVGELSGGADVDFEGVSLFNNYHFGSDEVELGVGSVNGSVYGVERWMAGSGNVFGNVRNATETMTATAMGNYRYDYGCMEDEVYWDFFMFSYSTWQEELGEDEYEYHADFDAATRNAVASEADMKSDMFAALLNRNPADYDAEYVASEHNIWSRSSTQNDGLPVFVSGSLQPNRIVVVAEKSSMGLTLEQESSLGFNEWSGSFCDTYGSVSKAMIGYTDASGHLSSDFQEKVGALLETIASNMGTDAAMLVDKQGNEVLLSAALSSNQEWRVVTPKTYDVVYQYCDYQNVCRLFENVTGTLLAFLTPRVDQYADAADAPLQLVPNVVSYYAQGWTEDELKFTFELQDEEGYSVDDAALGTKTPEGTDIWSFEDIVQKIRAAGVEGVKTIVLKYATPSSSYGEFPQITVQNPKMVDMEIDVYGYDQNSSMVQVAQSSASGEYDGITEGRVDYGVAVGIGEIQEKTGYTFDNTYSVAYQYIATLDNCTAPEPKNYVVTNKSFGSFDDLSAEMTACGTVEWKVEGLNVGDADDLVVLNNVKMASFAAKKKYGNSVTEKLVVVPSYSLVHYNVSFDLNLPEGIEDNSFIFFGRSWNAVKDLTVEGPNFPNVYTNACPTMIAWSPVADASELPSWYFDASYYKNYVNRNFLPYVTLDADNGNATTAYVYWKEDDCSSPETIVLYYTPKLKGAGIETSPATIVLKQTLNETLNTTVDHPMQVGDDQWYLQLPDVDDTMTFVVDVDVEKGYTISEITYEGIPKDDHGVVATDEEFTLGFNDPETGDRTLSVNTAMITSGELTIDFDYANYEVNFVRPTNELAVSLADKEVYVADPYTNEGWFDARVYTMANVDDEYASAMPELYALNGCIAWSTTSSYDAMSPVFRKFNETAVQNFGNSTELYPVYFTAEDNANLCGDAPTETFTVTAHGANLQGLELRQIIGVTGDGDVADTIKHQFTQDQDDETLWTLSVPKVSASQAVAESYVPFTFEIRAIPAEGYATYSESYYRLMVQEGDGALKVPYEDGILTTNGSNVTFYVDVIGGGYTVALDTTDWSYIAESNGVLGYSNDKHELYVLDEDRDLPDSYELGETAQKLPVLYAASYQGSSHTFVIAGWTYYPERANCVVTHAKNDEIYCMGGGVNASAEFSEIFTDFSGDLVAAALAAEAAGNLVIENKIITLRPVWTSATKADVGAQRVTIGCPKNETIDGCGTNDHPMTISLSQTFSMAGEQVTLTHTSDSAIALPWIDGHEEIAMDVAIQANPGYEVNSIKFEFIDEEVAEYNSAEGKMVFQTWNYGVNTHIVPDGLSYSDYTVTFDISSLKDSIVVLGKSWMEFDGTKSMNVGTKNEYPKIYVFTDYESKFNEVLWADAAKKETDFDEPADWDAWYTTFMSNTAIPKFNSDLIKNVLGDETSTEMTLYPLPVLYLQGNLEVRSYQEISAVVDVDHFPEEDDYHGHIVLTQTWNDMTFKQKSYLSNYSDYYELKLKCPWPLDDTLEFKVVTEPDPGYEMSLASENISDPDGEGWGYNAETGILKISGTHLGDLTVSYILQHYNVDFSIPADAEVFVASKLVSEDQYEVDWFDSQTDVTVDNIKAPVIYDANGCLVYWKVVDSDAHDSDLVNMLAYMISTESSDSASNMLVPDMEYTKCDQNSRTYKQTLTVEGEGTIHLEQVLGDAVVKHSFVEDGETGVLTLNVPAAYNEVEPDFQIQQTGVRFRVVAEPAEGYSLDEITYETYNDGNHQTNILRTDSSFVNVMRALPWTVKFKRLAPIYVTYDLSLSSAEDSANTYLPADAKTAETLEIASAADSVPFWKPFRTDMCFMGWSTTSLAKYVEGDDSLFTAFNVDNFSEFSTIGDNATKLYAIWGECSETPATTLAVENGEEHAKLVLYQLFGSDTLFHEITTDGVALAGDAFDFYLDESRTAPEFGYNFADDAEFAVSYTSAEITEPVSVEKDESKGVWHLTTDDIDGMLTYKFAIATDNAEYHLALDANAEDVFYGPDFSWNWSSENASNGDALPLNVYRSGYVLAGWVFDGEEQPLHSYNDDFVTAYRNYREAHDGAAPDTLHAVWTRSGQIGTYILQLSPETQERAAGTLTFSQTIGDSTVVSTIEGGTLLVPAIEGLQLNANFTLDLDHSFDGSAPISVMDYLSNPIASYANGDAIIFDESFGAAGTTIYIDVATAFVDYIFAFDVNAADGDTLFYGTNWLSEKSYSMEADDRAFPLSVYQRGKCLVGYALSETAATSYSGITPEFVAAYEEMDTKPTTLYGVWIPKGDDCNPSTVTLTTKNTSLEGTYTLTNVDTDFEGPSKDSPMVIPAADDLVFTVSFTAGDLYEAEETITLSVDDFSYTINSGSDYTFLQDMELNVSASPKAGEFALDVNAEGFAVYYGKGYTGSWNSNDAEPGTALPKNLYRTDAVVVGWSFSPLSDNAEDGWFDTYNEAFMEAYSALSDNMVVQEPLTLYAVWHTVTDRPVYTVTSANLDVGTLKLVHNILGIEIELAVGDSGLKVPAESDIEFAVSFVPAAGYEMSWDDEPITMRDGDDNVLATLENGSVYTFEDNTVVDVSVFFNGSYAFVLDVNMSETDTVFYGMDWDSEMWFDPEGTVAERTLPTNIYRTNAYVRGWSFRPMQGVAESGVYQYVDSLFIEEYKSALKNQSNSEPVTLYAVWMTSTSRPTYTVTAGAGTFELYDATGYNPTVYTISSKPLVVPAESDLMFNVHYASASQDEYDGVIAVYDENGTLLHYTGDDSDMFVTQNIVLKAETYFSSIEIALNMNAGSSNVFYGESFNSFWWSASSYGDTIPKDAYRTDAKLVGWSFYRNATSDQVFQVYDESFFSRYQEYLESTIKNITPIAEGDSHLPDYGVDFPTSQYPVLYAVWKKDSVETRMVTSESADQGVLMLSQNVGDSVFSYIVTEQGLQVPAVDNGIKFMVSFYPNNAWQLEGDKSIIIAENDKVGYVQNNTEWNMTESTAISIQASFNGYRLVFDVDTSETVFYGDDWVAQGNYGISSNKPADLPKMVYSSARCLAGWSVKSDSKHFYTALNESLVEEINEAYPKLPRDGSVAVTLYAHWATNVEDCAGKFNLVSIKQENGKVALVEAERRSMIDGKVEEENEKVHVFTDKGSMFLPADIPGNWYGVRSVPDSSFILDSLAVILDSHIVAVLHEGELLPEEIHGASFKAYFGKSNKTSIEIVEKEFLQSDNAIKLSFKASDFEVTRGVLARVQIIDVQSDTVVRDTLIGDSIAMAYEDSLVLLMNKPGTYKMVLTLEDSAELAEYSEEFVVKAAIEAFEADGWQMVSLAAVDTSAIDWTTGDQVFYWWDESGTGEYWNYKAFGRGDSIVNTRGAWYSSLKGNSLALLKDIEDDGKDAVWELDSVTSGWNLVANTHGWSVNLFANHPEAQKDVDEESEISFWSYNAEKADYEEVSVLKPYEAVWVKVSKKTEWTVSGAPVFTSKNDKETTEPENEGDSLEGRVLPRRVLAKSSTKDRWTLQAMLSDKNGKQDVWNILGAGNNPFVAEEPPSSMGDHVNLSILEGKRALAKSIKTSCDEMEWTVALSAASDRVGYLTLVGIDGVNAYGYHVYVTVDGNTTEMKDGVPLKVYLKSSAKTATVRVATAAKVVVQNTLRGLRSARLGNKLQVSFDASEGLAGTNARVDLMDMKGHVMSTVSAKTVAGSNALVLDAPKSGLYMLRVRAGSAQQAGKVLVK